MEKQSHDNQRLQVYKSNMQDVLKCEQKQQKQHGKYRTLIYYSNRSTACRSIIINIYTHHGITNNYIYKSFQYTAVGY